MSVVSKKATVEISTVALNSTILLYAVALKSMIKP